MDGFNPIWLVVVGLFAIAAVVFLAKRKKDVPGPLSGPAPGHLPGPSAAPPDVFIDRDDLLKWIGTSKFTHTVTLDGATVHGGFGPALAYVSGDGAPDKNIKRA